MKVNNNISNYNANINGAISYRHWNSGKDTFQKGAYNTSPSNSFPSININNLYDSKQLLKAYANVKFVNSLVNKNPKIKDIINSNGIEEVEVHPENVLNILNTHLLTTQRYALQLADKLNISTSDKKVLEQAAIFHDFGKILIPPEILNKTSELTPKEREIMDLHSELGYELLTQTGMNKKVLELVKNHHMPQSENNDILKDILSVADIYSALRENRSYKKPLSHSEAIAILDQKAKQGKVSTEVVEALKDTAIITANAA